jgi:hypothetical protein
MRLLGGKEQLRSKLEIQPWKPDAAEIRSSYVWSHVLLIQFPNVYIFDDPSRLE